MKKYLWIFSLAGLLFACNNNEDDPQPVPEKENMTILSYLVANNSLDKDLLVNIGAMYKGLAGMKEPATLLVYWDGKTKIGDNDVNHLLLKYRTDGKGNINGRPSLDVSATLDEILDKAEIIKEYPSQCSTDKEVMIEVLNDMTNLVTVDKIGLIAGSHASSWVPASSSRAFGDDAGKSIQIIDMVEAIASTGRTFDFLLFDACLMGSAEVCYDFRKVSNFQIVSVLEIPAYGFPYDLMLAYLFEGKKEGYVEACQTYIDYYNLKGNSYWGTISLIDSKKMEDLAKFLHKEITSHKDLLKDFKYSTIQEYGRRAYKYCSFDVKQFVKVLNDGVVSSSFDKLLSETVVYAGCVENPTREFLIDKENYSGIGLYIPIRGKYDWNTYFKTLDWYTAAGWNEVSFSWNF